MQICQGPNTSSPTKLNGDAGLIRSTSRSSIFWISHWPLNFLNFTHFSMMLLIISFLPRSSVHFCHVHRAWELFPVLYSFMVCLIRRDETWLDLGMIMECRSSLVRSACLSLPPSRRNPSPSIMELSFSRTLSLKTFPELLMRSMSSPKACR